MAEVTDKDLEDKRVKIAKLRDSIASEQAKAASVTQAQSNAIEAAQLDAEAAQLEAQLAAAKEQAKVTTIRSGSADLTETLKDAAKVASEVTPPGVTVDTNAGVEVPDESEVVLPPKDPTLPSVAQPVQPEKNGGNS